MKRRGKKLSAILTVLVAVLALVNVFSFAGFAAETEEVQEPVCYNHGDVNGDGCVDGRDAIYTLYHTVNPSAYPINQSCNFDGDGDEDGADAIWLLYASFDLMPGYQLEGKIHEYYDPEWTWSEDGAATAVFQCGCGEKHTFTEENGVEIREERVVAATCITAGSKELAASVTFEEETYTSTKTVTTPAKGHTMDGVQSCVSDSKCQNCEYTLAAYGHDWMLDEAQSKAATCQSVAVQVYKCARENCKETQTIELEGLERHSYVYSGDVHAEDCAYQKTYKCSACGAEDAGEVFYKHTYSASLTKEANCSAAGVKTYTCNVCGDSYTESVGKNDSHTWTAGAADDQGVTTYTCSSCGETKTAVCTDENSAVVGKETLQDSELQLQDVSIKLDEDALDALGETVKIEVQTVEAADLPIEDKSMIEQIGSNPVYDFGLTSDNKQVSQFGGYATITVPYELQNGDDVDCIDVWFISDDGAVECVRGTYSNGSVTFATNHFSYYTVTRLTPAQRCEYYGHAMVDRNVAATCTANGQNVRLCQRCGYEEENKVLPMVEHSYEETVTPATCMEEGTFEKICSVCKQKVSGVLTALGHEWSLDKEQSKAAGCEEAGREVYQCTHDGCNETYTEELSQLKHNYEIVDEGNADCTTRGYVTQKCSLCGDTYTEDVSGATGHDYQADSATWQWAEDYSSATVTLVCSFDESHTKTLNAVITRETEASSCTAGGKVTYKATASFNLKNYVSSQTVELEVVGHLPSTEWETNHNQHYHLCETCGNKIDTAAHIWGEAVVKEEATCATNGRVAFACAVCGLEKEETLAATGKHVFDGGVCENCGFEENSCTHARIYRTLLDLSEYDVCEGSEIYLTACNCGKSKYIRVNYLRCQFDSFTTREETLPNGDTYEVMSQTCSKCALTWDSAFYEELDEETCTTTYVEFSRFSKNGTVIAESRNDASKELHATNATQETVDLSEYGMCGDILVFGSCYCGEMTDFYTREGRCNWVWDPSGSAKETQVYTCERCGATKTIQYRNNKDEQSCTYTEENIYTFDLNGQTVYTCTASHLCMNHNYEVTDVEVYGDSCEDGVFVHRVCEKCGATSEFSENWHAEVYFTRTDLSGADICGGTFVQTECACGANIGCFLDQPGSYCMWMQVERDEKTGKQIDICSNCGATREILEERTEKDENCAVEQYMYYTYIDKAGNTIVSGYSRWKDVFHDWERSGELMGDTCEDGVKIKNVCRDCGETNEYTSFGHVSFDLESYDLTEYGLCNGTLTICGCFCRENVWESTDNSCAWEFVSGDENKEVYWCAECNTVKETVRSVSPTVDLCRVSQTTTITFSRDQETLLQVQFEAYRSAHRFVYTMELRGDSCEDGGIARGKCVECGYADETSFDGHARYAVEREMVSEGQLCGDLELVTYRCACGIAEHSETVWYYSGCRFGEEYYLDAEQCWAEDCTVCGATRLRTYDEQKVEGSCSWIATNHYTYRKNGSDLFAYDQHNTYESHAYLFTFALEGTTCEEGYYTTGICADCGAVWNDHYRYTDCGTWLVARELLYDGEDVCGDVYLETYASACGERNYVNIEDACQWVWLGYDSAKEATVERCMECGIERLSSQMQTNYPNSCDVDIEQGYTYSKDGQEILSCQREYTTKEHSYVSSFDMLGESCDDGYYVTVICASCGKSGPQSDLEFGHNTYQTAYYELEDYGMCGDRIWRISCPCGEYSYWNDSVTCDWQSTGKIDPETGLEEIWCYNCNTYRYVGRVGENTGNCFWEGTFYAKVIRNEEVLLDIAGDVRTEEHSYVTESFTMNQENGSCEDGYMATMRCKDCGNTTEQWSYGHETYIMEIVDLRELSDSLCGGRVIYLSCPCGENSGVDRNLEEHSLTSSWIEEGDDGYTHHFNEYTCGDCDLKYLEEWYDVRDVENCRATQHNIYTFYIGDQEIKTYQTQRSFESHSLGDEVCTLCPDAQTCEDGVYVTRTCEFCGMVDYFIVNYHEYAVVESIDLAPYGSVCGGYLNHYSCACGQKQRYDFDENLLCDMDRVWIENWIAGTIDTAQDTTEGYVGTWSDSYILTCAVTDPACSLKIRMSEYWLEENCVATEYQTWQLGYDPETGTCMEEITIPTGNRHAFHSYVTAPIDETLEDGTQVTGNIQICSECQSSYTTKYYYLNGNLTKYEEKAVNTLDNGERKRYSYVADYGFEHAGYRYVTLERYDYTAADGTVTWDQYVYEYDFANGCKRTETHTGSNGQSFVTYQDAHLTMSTYETVKESTCSQYGKGIHREICMACGETTYEETYTVEPMNHSWNYDSEKETNVCDYCGLENSNGASGAIVIEDLTERYGKDVNYVVGYWNRGDVRFSEYISVVLEDAADADPDEIVLTDIAFTNLTVGKDGVTAISFSQADAQAAAEAAMKDAGYTGSYAIRFTFVPNNSEDTLDYAITFDSLME